MANVCVRAHLASPLAGDPSLPLDGVLLALACERTLPPLAALAPGEVVDYDPALVPLEREGEGDDWFYACSFARWLGEHVDAPTWWNKRLDVSLAEQLTNARTVNLAKGHCRAYHYRMQARHGVLEWRLRGNIEAVRSLLYSCAAIGKKRAMGYGQVARWEVDEVDEDHSVVGADGLVTRAVPHSWAVRRRLPAHSLTGRRAIRPPYWAVQHLRVCFVPGRLF